VWNKLLVSMLQEYGFPKFLETWNISRSYRAPCLRERERERERESQLVNEEGSNLRAEAFFGDLHRTADEDLVGIIPRL
jgi:hypothetical protein